MKLSRNHIIALVLIALVIIDQAVKIWVKTNMHIGESYTVFPNWFFIHFIENPGAAYGLQIGGSYGKLFLSLFRIAAVVALIWYMRRLYKKQAPMGVIMGFGLILVGALGNIIDSAFYGMIFSESGYGHEAVATMFPEGGGYAGFLHGKVVDMLYFPIIRNDAGKVLFFSPVFNLADSYITIGGLYLLFFKWRYFK